MQTMTVTMQESFVPNFLDILNQNKEMISLEKSKPLKQDPYFEERRKEIQALREEIKSGKVSMVPHDKIWENIHQRIRTS